MGVYIEIVDDRGRTIASGKYGVGFKTLMFTDIKRDGKKVYLQATGQEAIDNLNRNIKFLRDSRTRENEVEVGLIRSYLVEAKNMIQADRIYTCDFSEFFEGNVNPAYDCFNLIQEWYDKMNDAIVGYHQYPRFPDNDYTETAFRLEIQNILDMQYGVSLEESNDAIVTYRIRLSLSNAEKEIINSKHLRDSDNDDLSYTSNYARRKLFHTFHSSELGFMPVSILLVSDTTFYVTFNRKDIDNWEEKNPYVFAHYKLDGTGIIEYILKNTPEEKEKFYCYAEWKQATSIVIGGTELYGLSDEDISESIGKPLVRVAYEAEDIVMKFLY